MFFVPLSPVCGIMFLLPKGNNKNDIYINPLFADSDATLDLNKKIAITETIYSKNPVIAKREKELLEIADVFKSKSPLD